MERMQVLIKSYDEEREVFKVLTSNAEKKEIAKEDMSIYNLKPPAINALLNQVIDVVYDKEKLTRLPLMRKRLEELTSTDPIGKIVQATIVSATAISLYADMGDGVSGIIHKSDIISCPVENPTSVFPLGSQIEVKIKKYDSETNYFTLTYKDMFKDQIQVKKYEHIVGIVRDPFFSKKNGFSGYYVQITPNLYGVLDSNFKLKNGEKLPMIVHEISQRGIRLRHEFPN